MDRETLSHYGWVVIIIIILAIMISLATPFASSIRKSITESVEGFNKELQAGMNDIYGDIGSSGDAEGGSGGDVNTDTRTPIAAPSVTLVSEQLCIGSVAGATGYELFVDDGTGKVSAGICEAASYDRASIGYDFAAGTYNIYAVAKTDSSSEYKDSDFSEPLTVTFVQLTAPSINVAADPDSDPTPYLYITGTNCPDAAGCKYKTYLDGTLYREVSYSYKYSFDLPMEMENGTVVSVVTECTSCFEHLPSEAATYTYSAS